MVLCVCFTSPYILEIHTEVLMDEIIYAWDLLQNNWGVGKSGSLFLFFLKWEFR